MMYPFMTLEDGTEIVHSEMKDNGEVKVYIETPDEEDGFHHMTCYLVLCQDLVQNKMRGSAS